LDARGAEPDFSSSPPKKDCVLTTLLLAAPLFSPSGSGLVSFLPFLLIIVVFYLLLIRPNQKKQQQWQQMLGSLKTGDKITTSGGIRGTILSIKDDAIQLRVPPDNIRIEVVKSAIASVTTDEAAK
jgi:preprotein translocase subunit YajC